MPHVAVPGYPHLDAPVTRSFCWSLFNRYVHWCFQKEANVPAGRVRIRRTAAEERAHRMKKMDEQSKYVLLCVDAKV